MTADEREAEIRFRCERLAHHMSKAHHHKLVAHAHADAIRILIAQRTPAEAEQMERERGLR